MVESTIAAGFARGLMDLAVRKGADATALARRAAISPADLKDQDRRIPFAKYVALTRAAKELTGDAALALHFGEAFEMAELSIVGLIGTACETVADAAVQLDRYVRLVADVEVDDPDGRRLVLARKRGQVWLIDTRTNPNAFPEMTESSFARMVTSARKAGAGSMLRALHVTHEPPSYRAEYDRIFQMPVTFGSKENALLMADDSFMAYRNPNPSRYVFGVLSERAEALLKELEAATSTRGRVERLLMPVLHTGTASMETIARQMGLSRQTVFRRLKSEGTSFEEALDALRQRLALDYLNGKKVSVIEAAYLVGFSDPTAFSRAFKRWTGASPRAYRASGPNTG